MPRRLLNSIRARARAARAAAARPPAGEPAAFFEFIDGSEWRFEYTGYSNDAPGCSAAVRLTA